MVTPHLTLLTQSGGREAAGELQDLIPKEPRGAGPAQQEDQVIHYANPAWVAAQVGLGTKGFFLFVFQYRIPFKKVWSAPLPGPCSKPLTWPWRWMQKGEASFRQEASPENTEPLGREAAGTPPSTHFLPPARPGGYPGHGWITARSGSNCHLPGLEGTLSTADRSALGVRC